MLEKCSSYIPQEAKHSHLLLSLWDLYFRKKTPKNSLLVYCCIQNQNKHSEISLNVLKLLSENGLFGFCFPAEVQMSRDEHVFWGTGSKQLQDTDNLLSLVHCFGLNNFLVICFSLRNHPFLVDLAGFCLLPFKQLHVCSWNVVMLNFCSSCERRKSYGYK